MVKIWGAKFLSLLLAAIFAVGAVFHTLSEHTEKIADYSHPGVKHELLHKIARHTGSCLNEHRSSLIKPQEIFCAICANLHSIAAQDELPYDETAVFSSCFHFENIFPPLSQHLRRQRSRAPPIIQA